MPSESSPSLKVQRSKVKVSVDIGETKSQGLSIHQPIKRLKIIKDKQ